MANIYEVIEAINQADAPEGRKQPLPNDALLERYEKETGFIFPADYKIFLKSVSNAFVGFLSPFTLNGDMKEEYGDLLLGLKEGREIGVPTDWIPICEDNGDYYCIVPDGKIRFWDHNGTSDEIWPDLATWARDVWLEGG